MLVGTGTSVGKTWVGCQVLRALAGRGIRATGLKPIESGVTGDGTSDAESLAALSATTPAAAPYCFREPISPHLAARREGARVELGALLTYVQHHESSERGPAPRVVLVETAGGLFTPLSDSLTNFDFARALEPARWVLVAPDALGVLHDVGATLGAARARGRAPDEVVLSRARPPDASTGTNVDELRRLGLVARPFAGDAPAAEGISELVSALLESERAPGKS